ncbi:MAG: APC family permease, partial [Clostridium sp.]|uniref:APC family permease n=1 Tax=Clostridium sp. TaxID=1506 RepID=UPI003F31F6E3
MSVKNNKKEIGLIFAIALVFSNIIGAGIFVIPSQLANVSGIFGSILAWIITGSGAIVLAFTFANLGSNIPVNGGVVEYSRKSFGNLMGFMTAWLYWNGCWIGNATLLIVILKYLNGAFPILNNNPILGFLICSGLLWLFTYINIRGTKSVGILGTILALLKLVILVLFIVLATGIFDVKNITPIFQVTHGLKSIPMAAAITFWAFEGIESATLASGEIKNPKRNVKLSTIIALLIALVFYLAITILAMGAMPRQMLANSIDPISQIMSYVLGSKFLVYINIAIALSICGSSLLWLFSTAKAAEVAGNTNLFPKIFSKKHKKYDTPYFSLIIGSILINLLLLLNLFQGLNGAYNFIVLLATLSYLPVYAVSTIAEVILVIDFKNKSLFKKILLLIRPSIAFI